MLLNIQTRGRSQLDIVAVSHEPSLYYRLFFVHSIMPQDAVL